jgi:23S rRNA (adenine-N6)-dimethyltransferase
VPGALVLDLGAGGGILTRALADAGARVSAVEMDSVALRELHARFGADPRVEVVEADATVLPLPAEPFAVVANLPFAAGTAILRRLLGDPRVPLTQLDAIVEWGLAAKRTAVWPSTLLGCTWGAWYELSLVRRVPRACFAPPPSVDAAVLRALRRPEPLVPPQVAGAYAALLRRAFAAQAPLSRVVPRGVVHRVAHELGFDPHACARDLDARQWAALYAALRPATPRPRAAGPRRRRGSRR